MNYREQTFMVSTTGNDLSVNALICPLLEGSDLHFSGKYLAIIIHSEGTTPTTIELDEYGEWHSLNRLQHISKKIIQKLGYLIEEKYS